MPGDLFPISPVASLWLPWHLAIVFVIAIVRIEACKYSTANLAPAPTDNGGGGGGRAARIRVVMKPVSELATASWTDLSNIDLKPATPGPGPPRVVITPVDVEGPPLDPSGEAMKTGRRER